MVRALVGDGASASVARPSSRAKSSAAAYGQVQRAPFRTPPRSLCLVVQVLDAQQRMLAVMPRNLEELSECRVHLFRRETCRCCFCVAAVVERPGHPADAAKGRRSLCDGHSRAPLTSQAGKVDTAGARGFDEVACEQQHCWRRTRLICRSSAKATKRNSHSARKFC